MSKILDFILTGSWSEYQEVQLMKKAGKVLDKMSEEEKEKLSKEELIKLLKKRK